MIENRWLRPRLLKEIDFSPFFEWFEVKHSERELKQVVIEIDRTQATLAIHLRGRSTYQTPEVPNEQIEKITLHIVESRLLKRFKNIH